MAADDPEEITLGFELEALRAFANPSAVLRDARRWTSSIGVVTDAGTPVVRKFGREHGYRFDFFSGSRTERESLAVIVDQPEHDADRFVLVVTDDADADLRAYAADLGWEVRTVSEASEMADWPVATEPEDDGEDGDDQPWF